MSDARQAFFSRINNLEQALKSEAVITKSLIAENREHNEIARLLRNGLAVVGFTALEDFIKQRSSEVVLQVGRSSVAFNDLPEKLREAATFEAVKAFSFQLSHRGKEEKILYIQDHAEKIASTKKASYELSSHIFGYDQSNVNSETVKKVLKSFNVENPWSEMTRISSQLGLTALPLEETFRNAAQRRHKAAHVASADTPYSDLLQFVTESHAIGLTFDLLLTKALSYLFDASPDFLNGSKKIAYRDIKIRTIKYVSEKWKEYSPGSTRARVVSDTFDESVLLAVEHLRGRGEFLLAHNEIGKLVLWSDGLTL